MTVTHERQERQERTTERRGLGRGLGELFQRTDVPAEPRAEPTGPTTAAPAQPLVPVPEGSSYAELPLDAIVPNPRQPRSVFDGDALEEGDALDEGEPLVDGDAPARCVAAGRCLGGRDCWLTTVKPATSTTSSRDNAVRRERDTLPNGRSRT